MRSRPQPGRIAAMPLNYHFYTSPGPTLFPLPSWCERIKHPNELANLFSPFCYLDDPIAAADIYWGRRATLIRVICSRMRLW